MKHVKAALAATVSLFVVASPALAQDAQDDSGFGDIVVTAQKRAENIQDVPIAISAVSSEYLESRGLTSIDSLGSIARARSFAYIASNAGPAWCASASHRSAIWC